MKTVQYEGRQGAFLLRNTYIYLNQANENSCTLALHTSTCYRTTFTFGLSYLASNTLHRISPSHVPNLRTHYHYNPPLQQWQWRGGGGGEMGCRPATERMDQHTQVARFSLWFLHWNCSKSTLELGIIMVIKKSSCPIWKGFDGHK